MSDPPPTPGPFADPPVKPDEIDLGKVHGSILREHEEPAEGRESVPLWFVTLIMMLVFWAGFYLANHSGGFRANVFNPVPGNQSPVPPDPATLGRRVFVQNCVICHQASGLGVANQYPPLAGSEWVLARNGHADNYLAAIVIHGLEGPVIVNGRLYNGAMPPWKFLRDEEIAAVLTYVRSQWGNAAASIGPDFVRQVRERTADRAEPWTQRELQAIEGRTAPKAAGNASPAP
ncbi:MAG: cytochrome c [Terrimicrobiaceae bacterium]|nr:cytochrome c [Terrimicrobiaceae bacterium]